MNEQVERKHFLIMKILQKANTPLSSHSIREQLAHRGITISERTVRFHLQALDAQGFTNYKEKKGRFLTSEGFKELNKAHVYERIGFLSAKIDEMICKMTFNPRSCEGSVLINLSLIDINLKNEIPERIMSVFRSGFAHGKLMALFSPGEKIGETIIPDGQIGLGTVCSITFNGVLIQMGIPITSVFGGLLEIHEKVPTRFISLIRYNGTSLDPLEIFITSKMTQTSNASQKGYGLIGASFREVPASARERVMEIDTLLNRIGLGGYLRFGYPGESLLDIPVDDNRLGIIIAGGLNAIAPLVEAGLSIRSRALSGLVDYQGLFPYEELGERLQKIC